MPVRHLTLGALLTTASVLAWSTHNQRGEVLQWNFSSDLANAGFVSNASTPNLTTRAAAQFAPDEFGAGLVLNRSADAFVIAPRASELEALLPSESMTVAAWVALERTHRWGGIVSCVQDNGGYEKGFVLGYENDRFSFALATEGADDGDGKLTYFQAKSPFEFGRWHHVVGTYDGKTARLFVDGKLEAETKEQSGALLIDPTSPFVLGAYRDSNEDHPMDGRLFAVSVEADAWSSAKVQRAFERDRNRVEFPAWTDLEFGLLVEPYLTWPTKDAISVLFELTFPAQAEVRYWPEDGSAENALVYTSKSASALHECRLEGLEPDTKYFYHISAQRDGDEALNSEVLSFRTAASPGMAFTFVVIGDTQTNGDVAKRVSDLAYMHRPNLVVHAGDLVDTGTNKRDWTDTFFPSMQPLIGRVPLMPVLGNHEQDADHYYEYMSLPEPERWYSFTFGDAEFFMIDGNRSLADQSAQLDWLESALSKSKAKWKFSVLHQPPYTSDSNDYGDTTKTTSTRGDPNVRNIIGLLEKHGVDICFSGHVHDYERTFPILKERVTEYAHGGVIYVTAAGGGGHLEDFDPANTWFGHKKARYHHLVYVALHGDRLEFQAIDENGRLFDALELIKRRD